MAKQVAVEIDIKGTKDVIELQKQIRAINKELKTTEDQEAFEKLGKDLVKLKAQLREARKAQRQAVDAFAATDEGIGAYSRLSAELRVARNRLKDLQAAGTSTGEEVDQLTRTVNELDSTLKDIDRSVGQTNREIGQYEEAVRKAVGITDAQTGAFTRLQGRAEVLRRNYRDLVAAQGANSEAARKLKKELDSVEKQLKATGNQADRAAKRIGGFRTQLRNLGPTAANLASGFLIFSELPQIFSEVSEALQTLGNNFSSSIAASNGFKEGLREGAKELVAQKGALNNTFAAIQQAEFGTEEYTAAIEAASEQFPFLNDELIQQELQLGNVAAAQNLATDALIRNIVEQQTAKFTEKIYEDFAESIAESAIQAEESTKTYAKAFDVLTGSTGKALEGFSSGLIEIDTRYSTVSENLRKRNRESLIETAGLADQVNSDLIEGFTEINKALDEAGFGAAAQAAKFQKQLEEDRAKRQEEAEKRALKAAEQAAKRLAQQRKREAEKRIKEQERVISELVKNEASFAQMLNKLEQDTIKQTLENADEGLSRELKIEENASLQRIKAFQATTKKFEEEAKARQERVNKAFGEGSQQAIATQKTIANQRLQLNKATNEAIEAETTATLKKQDEIRKTFEDKAVKERQDALKERLTELQAEQNAIVAAAEQEQLKIRELRAKGQIDAQQADKQAFETRVQALKDQIAQLNQQEFALIGEEGAGTEVAQEAFDKIAGARQQLNTQLAELEEAQTKKLEGEAQKRTQINLEAFKQAAKGFLQTVEIVSGIGEIVSEANQRRLQEEADLRQQNIADLQNELNQASGLERAFLEQRVQQETEAAQEIAAQQERAEKEAAIAKKAVSITEAVINTALGITNALASLPPPASFVTAAITGALGAVQIATIAAQPLATGGVVGQNITGQPIRRSNGDDTLTTLKRGEVVLNQRQQARLGGPRTFAAAGVPGFANGGVVSPPMRPPTLAEAQTDSTNVLRLIETNQKTIQELKNAVMRQEVVYTTNTDESIKRDKMDRKEITQRATL